MSELMKSWNTRIKQLNKTYWSSPVFIQLAFVVLCKVTENQRFNQLFIVKNI